MQDSERSGLLDSFIGIGPGFLLSTHPPFTDGSACAYESLSCANASDGEVCCVSIWPDSWCHASQLTVS